MYALNISRLFQKMLVVFWGKSAGSGGSSGPEETVCI